MTILLVALLVAVAFAAAMTFYARDLYRQLSLASYERDNANSKLGVTELSYKSLLQRAGELAQEKVAAGQLVNQVGGLLNGLKDQLQNMLSTHNKMHRALKDIANFCGKTEGVDYTATLKELAAKALPGLTAAGFTDVVVKAITSSTPTDPEAFRQLEEAGGVCADQRHVCVDLSSQAANIRASIHSTVGQLQDMLARPLTGDPDRSVMAVAAGRLDSNKLAIDLVPSKDGSPGIAIVTENQGYLSGDRLAPSSSASDMASAHLASRALHGSVDVPSSTIAHTAYGCAEDCSHPDHKQGRLA